MFEYPVSIAANVPNGTILFTPLKRYRIQRRLGVSLRIVTEGRTLALMNESLYVVRCRFGGRATDPACVSSIVDGQS